MISRTVALQGTDDFVKRMISCKMIKNSLFFLSRDSLVISWAKVHKISKREILKFNVAKYYNSNTEWSVEISKP